MALIISQSCRNPDSVSSEKSYQNEIHSWQTERLQKLKAKNGWLNLAGLFWLKEGENSIGSDSANSIVFQKNTPAFIGKISLAEDSIYFTALSSNKVFVNGEEISACKLNNDQQGNPTIVETADFAFHIIKREDRFGIRLRWYKHPNIDALNHIPSYNISSKWRIKAEFIPFDTLKVLQIGTMIGGTEDYLCPGLLKFKIGFRSFQLYPSNAGDGFFIIFGDNTSGKESYAAGRFLYVEAPDKNNQVIIDFNKAYNPPCAFTPYATCPLPPFENILNIEIKAGEKDIHLTES